MTAGRLCSRILATASPDESVRKAAKRMADYDVGALVVLKEDRGTKAVGMITDRDIVLRCIAERRDLDDTSVSEVMSKPVYAVRDETPLEEAVSKMASTGTRRLVVTAEGDRVAGILTLDDVLDEIVRETAAIGKVLQLQQPQVPA
jgi:CBS domain-containing protein